MIDYSPLWETMKKREITGYKLIFHYGLSSNTLRRLRNNQSINTTTLNQLCLILKCNVWDVINFTALDEELKEIEEQRLETIARFSHPRKKKSE